MVTIATCVEPGSGLSLEIVAATEVGSNDGKCRVLRLNNNALIAAIACTVRILYSKQKIIKKYTKKRKHNTFMFFSFLLSKQLNKKTKQKN